jgi:hypothetical protein
MGLHTAIDALKQEKIQAQTNHEASVAAEWKIFWDYRLDHRKRLHELHVALEGGAERDWRMMPAISREGQHHQWSHHMVRERDSGTAKRDCQGKQKFLGL